MKCAETRKLVILGTGGTIAGQAASASDNVGYTAAQVGIGDLLAGVPGLNGCAMVSEQVAQVDSKDMTFDVWQRLLARVSHHILQDDVAGVVITHGTDTLEETAWFLHLVLAHAGALHKPVVLTCAMRPASSQSPDGPQNLLDAVALASDADACGVLAVCAGVVHGARDIQKIHSYRLDAFSSGEAGPVAMVEEGRVRWLKGRASFDGTSSLSNVAPRLLTRVIDAPTWPRIEIVMSHAGADGRVIELLLRDRAHLIETGRSPRECGAVEGIVVSGTGNGTLHRDLEAALVRAAAAGVCVWRTSRCYQGAVISSATDALPAQGAQSPVKARIGMMLSLL